MDSQFSDFIVYADESGDHGMVSIDPQYPVFVLVFCVIRKTDYINSIVPAMQRFKFKFWGHDSVILHEFFSELRALVESAPMILFSLTVDKKRLDNNYPNSPLNPYETGLIFCMEWLRTILTEQGEHGKSVTVIFESRGRREDADLESQFRDIAFSLFDFQPVFVPKAGNCPGLQLADLIARPIGLSHLRPNQPNRAWNIIKTKPGDHQCFPRP